MKAPVELAYSGNLPDDLKVLLHEQKVPVDDPLIALLAWHWLRINESQDAIQDGILSLKAALDIDAKQRWGNRRFALGHIRRFGCVERMAAMGNVIESASVSLP